MAPVKKKKKSEFAGDKSYRGSLKVDNTSVGGYSTRLRTGQQKSIVSEPPAAESVGKVSISATVSKVKSPSSVSPPSTPSTSKKELKAGHKRKVPVSLTVPSKKPKPAPLIPSESFPKSSSNPGTAVKEIREVEVQFNKKQQQSSSSVSKSALSTKREAECVAGTSSDLQLKPAEVENPLKKKGKGQTGRLRINRKPGLPIEKEKMPHLQHIIAQNHHSSLVKRGHVKFKIMDYKDTTQKFMDHYLKKTNSSSMDSCKLYARFDEFFRISDGLFYVRHHSHEESLKLKPVFKGMAFSQISGLCGKHLDKKEPKLTVRHLYYILDKLPLDIHRNGRGLLLPYIEEDYDVRICKDEERMNLKLDSLQSPLRDVHVDSCGNVKRIFGVTVPRTNIGFPGSMSVSRISEGPALDEVNVIVAGSPRCWLFAPAVSYERVRDLVLEELREIGLEKDDHLLTNKGNCILQHQCLLLTPSFYKRHSIKHELVMQEDGEVMIIGAKVINSSMSTGNVVSKYVGAAFSDFHVKFNHGQGQCDCPLDVTASTFPLDERTDDSSNSDRREVALSSDVSSDDEWSEDFSDDKSSISSDEDGDTPKRFKLKQWEVNRLLKMSAALLQSKGETMRAVGGQRKKYVSQKKERKYPCTSCKRVFVSQDTLDGHLADIANKCNKYGKCPVEGCPVKPSSIDSQAKFEQHMRAHEDPNWRTKNVLKASASRKKTKVKKKKGGKSRSSDQDKGTEEEENVSPYDEDSQSSDSADDTAYKNPVQKSTSGASASAPRSLRKAKRSATAKIKAQVEDVVSSGSDSLKENDRNGPSGVPLKTRKTAISASRPRLTVSKTKMRVLSSSAETQDVDSTVNEGDDAGWLDNVSADNGDDSTGPSEKSTSMLPCDSPNVTIPEDSSYISDSMIPINLPLVTSDNVIATESSKEQDNIYSAVTNNPALEEAAGIPTTSAINGALAETFTEIVSPPEEREETETEISVDISRKENSSPVSCPQISFTISQKTVAAESLNVSKSSSSDGIVSETQAADVNKDKGREEQDSVLSDDSTQGTPAAVVTSTIKLSPTPLKAILLAETEKSSNVAASLFQTQDAAITATGFPETKQNKEILLEKPSKGLSKTVETSARKRYFIPASIDPSAVDVVYSVVGLSKDAPLFLPVTFLLSNNDNFDAEKRCPDAAISPDTEQSKSSDDE